MKTKTLHTPTPWKNGASVIWEDGTSKAIAQLEHLDRSISEVKANAAFIVRAVNAHGDLLEALKTWQKFWDTMPKGQMGNLVFDVGLFNDSFIFMRKAIAKAEGRNGK